MTLLRTSQYGQRRQMTEGISDTHTLWSAPDALGLFASRLAPPAPRPGTVVRTSIVNRLRAARDARVVSLAAPAGYGKTTVLTQWIERDERPSAWISVDEHSGDNPRALLADLDASIARIAQSPASRGTRATRELTGVARIARAATHVPRAFLLVVDDAHLLPRGECVDALVALIENAPAGSTIAFAGRTDPPLPFGRLRAHRRLLEFQAPDLALTNREAHLLLRGAGVSVPSETVLELNWKVEGWPAALYLASLAVAAQTPFGGDDRFVVDYVRAEHLSHLDAADEEFLTYTSILEELSGPICDAVLDRHDSARKLDALERSKLFVISLDHRRAWFRQHRLVRETLRSELEMREPELADVLHRRAAAWLELEGDTERSLEHALAARDETRAVRLLSAIALPAYHAGRAVDVAEWFGRLGAERVAAEPSLALVRGWIDADNGRVPEAERNPAPATEDANVALLRAMLCAGGVDAMQRDADLAAGAQGEGEQQLAAAFLLQGVASRLAGRPDAADAFFADSVGAAHASSASVTEVAALVQRALLAEERGANTEADGFATAARRQVDAAGLGGYATSGIVFAASARVGLRHGDADAARADLAAAARLAPNLTHAIPWCAVQTLLELAHAHLGLLDATVAAQRVAQATSIIRRRPELGVLVEETAALASEIDIAGSAHNAPGVLTTAELRLLPLLATHLTLREIGERLYISRNTVKTQAISVYRKFGVSSRSEAIARASALGLV
jgi:LuxR family transcriptional regulator, maltose regulon positive regulatory protein